jgi:WD40 repeat protein
MLPPDPPSKSPYSPLTPSLPAASLIRSVTAIPCGHIFDEDGVIACLALNKLCPQDSRPIEGYIPNYLTRCTATSAPLKEEDVIKEAKSHFLSGKRLYEIEDYQGAITAFLSALQLNPKNEKAQAYLEFSLRRFSSSAQPSLNSSLPQNSNLKEDYTNHLLALLDHPLITSNLALCQLLSELAEGLMAQDNDELTAKQKESYKWSLKLIVESKLRPFVVGKLMKLHGQSPSSQENLIPPSSNLAAPVEISKLSTQPGSLSLECKPTIHREKIQAMRCVASLEGHTKTSGVAFPKQGPLGCFLPGYDYKVADVMVASMTFSSQDTLISGGHDGTIKLWDLPTKRCIKIIERVQPKDYPWLGKMLILADGTLAVGYMDALRLWDLSTGKCIKTLPSTCCYDIAQISEGILASANHQIIEIWDLRTEKCLSSLKPSSYPMTVLAGNKLACRTEEKAIQVWNLLTGEHLKTLEMEHPDDTCISLATLTNNIIAAGTRHGIKLLDISSGECIKTLAWKRWHDFIDALTVLPDGTLVSACRDNTIKLWDPFSGECLNTLEQYGTYPCSLTVLPDGTLVSGNFDGTIRLWK